MEAKDERQKFALGRIEIRYGLVGHIENLYGLVRKKLPQIV